MAQDLLTLHTEDGRHALPCPVGAVLDLGHDPACEIMLEGEGVLPHHCMLRRMAERHFRVTAIATSARFTVNGVIATDLGVDVPFTFGIDGESIEFDLAAETEAESPAAEPGDPPSASGTGSDSGAVAGAAATARSSRRDYLLQPATIKLRTGRRAGEVLLERPSAALHAEPKPPQREALPPAARPPLAPAETQRPAQPAAPAAGDPPSSAGEEESSPLLLGGLLVCAAMVAGIFWWQHQLDAAEAPPRAASSRAAELQAPAAFATAAFSEAETLAACRSLHASGAAILAAQLLLPAAEAGDVEATLELAHALQDAGQFGPEVIFLLQQAAEGGSRQAWDDLVAAVDHEDNPERFAPSSFQLLRRAAALGIPSAWLPLGERHEHGNGTQPDVRQAMQAFEHAQAAGDARAAAKLSARDGALQRVAAFVRSWNEVSVATLLEHVSATPGRFFTLEHPPMDALLRSEEELRSRWPLRRIRVVAGAQAEIETFDLIKVAQPFQFEVECGQRAASGTGLLACTVQRDTAGAWRVTEAADTITLGALRPGPEKFISASSLRALKPALSSEERAGEARQQILREMRGIEQTQDFKAALAAIIRAGQEFSQEPWWRSFADTLCDRMARQLFAEGRWLDAAWAREVRTLAEAGSISAMLLEGHLFAAGYGLQRDASRSTSIYQKAFESSKRRDARFYYAEALFQGRGVPQDLQKAGTLVLPLMTSSRHPLEAYLAAHLLWRKAEKDPALWQQVYDTLSRVAEKHAPARHLAAMVLLNHGNTTRERRTGFAALKAAAEAGVPEAMKNLSKCYQDGTGCEADFQAATLWKQKAAITEPPRRRHYTEFEE